MDAGQLLVSGRARCHDFETALAPSTGHKVEGFRSFWSFRMSGRGLMFDETIAVDEEHRHARILLPYSARRATMGSTRVARIAGMALARNPTPASRAPATASVMTSLASMPYRRWRTKRP